MTRRKRINPPIQNHLLAALPPSEYRRLQPHLEPVYLSVGQVLSQPAKPIAYAYFPKTSVLSVLTMLQDGTSVEISTVGNEGMLGIPLVLGSDRPLGHAVAQVPGEVVRVRASTFKNQVRQGGVLLSLLHRYLEARLIQMAQTAACHSHHTIEQRCARWLLMIQDRVGSDTFQLTQQFLAVMMGVRQASVSAAASQFLAMRLIHYQRGRLTILDRQRLVSVACECYGIIKAEFDHLVGRLRRQ